MSRAILAVVLALSLSEVVVGQTRPAGTWHAQGSRGAVAAGGAAAVDAGVGLLKSGGNAADAAAATLLALSVTDSGAFCFGGESPILVWSAKRGCAETLVALGAAPRLATREHFARKGIPAKGIEPAAVPGAFDGVLTLLERHGTRTFAEAAAPTLALLDRGAAPWHADLARTLRRLIETELKAGGDRVRGLGRVRDAFYRGPIAREIDAWSRANGGLIRFADLATHATRVEEPVVADYRGHKVLKCGPWTQGPCLLQTLRLLEGFDLKALGHNSPAAIHLAAEAMKLAFADRDQYYADPNFTDVPLTDLLADRYTQLRRPLIDPERASRERRPGDPRGNHALLTAPDLRTGLGQPGNDTTTCVVADAEGNVVAATPSGFSGELAGKTGVHLGSRLQSFNVWEGHGNVIEPGKRPRITLTPTLVLKDGRPVLAVSVAGGDLQDQTTLQVLLNVLDFGLPPERAVTAPRWSTGHHLGSFRQTSPQLGSLTLNPEVGEATVAELRRRGHQVTVKAGAQAAPVLLRVDMAGRRFEVAGDPKAGRHAGAP